MSGFGEKQPAGTTSFGLGEPVAVETSADMVAARALKAKARDYSVDDDALAVPHDGWAARQQNVVLRLSTKKGRLPYDRSFGNAFLALRKMPADLQGFAVNAAAEALKDLVSAGEVEILSVQTESHGGLAVMAVTWRDLLTGREETSPPVSMGA